MKNIKHSVLIIVDMQNDFITGSLANPAAEAIIPKIYNVINRKWPPQTGAFICTRDTHSLDTYFTSEEGKHLNILHCIKGTEGWEIHEELQEALRGKSVYYVDKPTFGYKDWKEWSRNWDNILEDSEIYLCGTCTDICVVSNALILKALYPENEIYVYEDLCAGTTEENHKAAIDVMRSCQIGILKAYYDK